MYTYTSYCMCACAAAQHTQRTTAPAIPLTCCWLLIAVWVGFSPPRVLVFPWPPQSPAVGPQDHQWWSWSWAELPIVRDAYVLSLGTEGTLKTIKLVVRVCAVCELKRIQGVREWKIMYVYRVRVSVGTSDKIWVWRVWESVQRGCMGER